MHRSQSVIDLMKRSLKIMNVRNYSIDDEDAVNSCLIPSGVKAIKLPYFLYPVGHVYFDHKIQFFTFLF